jgi:hypothetical protein
MELYLAHSHSLKEKRTQIKSLKDKIRNKFNVSIAEVGFHEKWQRAELGIALISHNHENLDQIFNSIRKMVENQSEVEIISYHLDKF